MRVLVALLLSVCCSPLSAQQIACEKYTLPNGMTVILHQDHRLPRVVVNTWFRVGAKDEPPGRSGFAHLYEHLMFMGTERVPGGDFDTIMEGGGGWNNASTSLDRTNYFSQGPSALLPTLLWLDADRLEDMGRMMDQQKLDKQREVVRNEIRENVENRPYGRAEESVLGIMFPPGHPYHNGVYGRHQDLEAATVNDVKDFFATFYVPSNASLVVAGDFDPAVVKPMIEELFGTLPRGGEVVRPTAAPARLEGYVRRTMLDKVQLPLLKMVWHSPGRFQDGDAAMHLLGAVLAGGKDSRLHKRLVIDDKLAVDVSAYQDGAELGSLFQIDVTVPPGTDLGRVEQIVFEELRRLVADGVGAAELAQRQAGYELRTLASLQDLGRVADALNQYEYHWGEPDSFARDLDRFRNGKPADLQRAAERFLLTQYAAVLRVLPEQPQRGPGPRDQRPTAAAAAATPFVPPLPEQFQLGNGTPVWFWRRPELPIVSLQVLLAPGRPVVDPKRAGLTALMTDMLDEGAGELDALAFGAAVQALGATLSCGSDRETVALSLTVLKRNLAPAASLLCDALLRPRLTDGDWRRVHGLHLERLRQLGDDPGAVAGRVARRALFGAHHPYGWPADGTLASVGALSLDDARLCWRELVRAEHATILIAGDLTSDEARAVLEHRFGSWARGDAPARAAANADLAPPAAKRRLLLVHRPEAVQTVVVYLTPGPRYDDPRRIDCQLLNTVLGGGFTSRLNQNLREKHGFSYGAGSGFAMMPWLGTFTASASVQTEVTGAALREFEAEFARLRNGERGDVQAAELDKARQGLRNAIVESYGTLSGLIGAASDVVLNGQPPASARADLLRIDQVDLDALNRLCRDALQLDRGVLVLVGDRNAILPQLEGLGLPAVVEVDVDGKPVAR